jgi:hypothetical protein
MKFRRIVVALLAAVALGTAVAPGTASARGWRGGWGRGFGWGPAIGLGLGLGIAGAYPYYGYGGPYYAAASRGCWRRVVVGTPWGPRVRRVWVC